MSFLLFFSPPHFAVRDARYNISSEIIFVYVFLSEAQKQSGRICTRSSRPETWHCARSDISTVGRVSRCTRHQPSCTIGGILMSHAHAHMSHNTITTQISSKIKLVYDLCFIFFRSHATTTSIFAYLQYSCS